MKRSIAAASVVATTIALLSPILSWAHHSYSMFDRTRVVTISGSVRKIQRISPHGTLWLTVVNDKGKEELWAVQLTGRGIGRDAGKDDVKEGDKIKLEINPLKDGRTGGSLVRATTADGRVLTDPAPPVSQAESSPTP